LPQDEDLVDVAVMPSNAGGLFSSLTSLFSGTGLAEGSSSSSSYLDRKRSVYRGTGLPTTFNRSASGASVIDDDDAAWRMPYNQYTSSVNTSTSEAYPPRSAVGTPGGQPYGAESTSTLVPGNAAQSRQSLSLATNVSMPSTAYPPLKHTWRRIRTWCNRNYSELGDTLNWPATEAQLDDLELTIGFALPPAVRDSYLCYDGQELESNQSCNDGLFFGLPLLSVERIAEEWRFWRNVDEDPTTGANPEVRGWMCSCPAGWVRAEYSCRGWIPLITDHVGNYIGIDLSPNPNGGGSPGQVILFGRDFDTKIVLWRGEGEGGWGRFLQCLAEELESGELWTLEEEVSNDSNDEEDVIGYDSYFSGGGSGAGRGGGDRGGDGAAGFKLKGEYKGWPVFEAWADRSMRAWEEIGMPSGQPAWRSEKPTPSVVLEEAHAGEHRVDENGESLDAEGSGPYDAERNHDGGASSNVSSSSTVHQTDLGGNVQGGSHPLDTNSTPATPTLDENNARYQSSTLSPPPMHSYRGKQKSREDSHADLHSAEQKGARRAPPVPAAPLDLPTIDDVRAAHAAAIAAQSRGGNFHYDLERAARPPPGMGGMGMGMGVASTNTGGYRTNYRAYENSRSHQGALDAGTNFHRADGVELEHRTSNDGFYSVKRDSEQGLVGLSESRRGSATMEHHGSPRTSVNGVRSPNHLSAGRTLYAASNSSEAVDTLIDASSSPDVTIQIEGTKAAANGGLPGLPSNANAPNTSSPLAKHSPVFASLQSTVNGVESAQPMTA
jgi:cell wall assembly regulator SMI1